MKNNNFDDSLAPVQASVHVLIPLYIHNSIRFRGNLLKSKEWNDTQLGTNFYLRYVNTIFCAQKNSDRENPLMSRCLVMENNSYKVRLTVRKHTLNLESVRIFCFDTSVGILDLRLAFSCERMEDVANVCARLRQTELKYPVQKYDPVTDNYLAIPKIAINSLAGQLLLPLGKITLYDHIGSCGSTRAEFLASVITNEEASEELDSLMFHIAEGVDMRSEGFLIPDPPYCPLPHIRWAITRKGACNVGLLTDNEDNRRFVSSRWHDSVNKCHLLWYVMVLHQKYAIYRYLNDIAQKRGPSDLKTFQKKIMAFNTEHRFEVISEDPAFQIPYEKARETKSVEQLFMDIDEEIQRIHTYHDAVRDKNNGMAMTIVSLVCAISTFVDIFSMSLIEQPLSESLLNPSVFQLILYGIIACAMTIVMVFLVIKPICRKIGKYIRRFYCWLLRLFLLRRK